jgi:hypothetical protein
MPVISIFEGIKIEMYYDDHNPPHFHATYGGRLAIISIKQCCVIKGSLPSKQLLKVLKWNNDKQSELIKNWELARAHKELNYVDPL